MTPDLIDVNVTLSRWPFRRIVEDEPDALAEKLQANGVRRAWAGTFDALLHKDLGFANTHLAEVCRGYPIFEPMGAVNPTLPRWQDDIDACAGTHGMQGIRLHPGYHRYDLASPFFVQILQRATELKMLVQLSVQMEDERMMHPLLRVKPVDLAPLPAALQQVPGARVVVLNALKGVSDDILKKSAGAGAVYFDIGMLETVGGIEKILKILPLERLLFGSHAPLFYHESAVLKLQESQLSEEQVTAISHGNAQQLLR